MGKNLTVKQPHPSRTCTMYYLQHKVTIHLQCKFNNRRLQQHLSTCTLSYFYRLPKASILHQINQPRVTMNTSETSSPPMHFHVSKHESTHPMPCFTNALFRKTQSANLLSLFTFLCPPAYLKPLHCVCFYRNKLTQIQLVVR